MLEPLKKLVLSIFLNEKPREKRDSIYMHKRLFLMLGIVSAVVIFLSISAFFDFSKTLNSIKNSHTPSASLPFAAKKIPSAKLMSEDKLKDILGKSEVKAAEDAEIIFNLDGRFTAPVIFEENITAPNIVYEVTAGTGIIITGDPQRPVISLATPTATTALTSAVTSLQDLTGDVDLKAGTNISISKDGNIITINNTAGSSSTLSEDEVEAYIFDEDNTGTLSSGVLALSSLSYTGSLPSGALSGAYTGITGLGTLTELNINGEIVSDFTGTGITISGGSFQVDILSSAPESLPHSQRTLLSFHFSI